MARYQFRFSIPEAQQGNHQIYTAYVNTLQRLSQLKGTRQANNIRVEEVQATSGSVAGAAMIDAASCEEAMRFVCTETPILDLEWHVEEYVDPGKMADLLSAGLKKK